MPVAPSDADALTSPDGMLSNVTAASISDTSYGSGLDYFGQLLKQITLQTGATQVDVVAHSTGGLIARSYIQSAAYGESFGAGLLPEVDDLVLVGVPNQGVPDAWNFLNDDFSESSMSRGLAKVVDEAYDRMLAGATINGPDYSISNLPPISKAEFVRKYVGSLRDLIPTYNAIDTNADGIFENLNPRWVELGPTLVTSASLVVSPNNPINGAIESIAFHPTNKDIAYAAAVSGGVWRTDNFRDANPTWVPLTDNQPSTSSGAIAVSPLDATGNTVFVGTAALSGLIQVSEFDKGLLVTVDGGKSWSNVAPASVFGGSIFRVLPTTVGTDLNDQVVLVAAENGISRSTDGGATWTLKSGSSGLPAGYATDIVADPNNPSRYYAAIPGSGVFVSTNTGENWSRIDNNPGFGITGIAGSSAIRLTIHDAGSTSVLYVGVVNSNFELSGVFRDVLGGNGVDNNSANGADDAAEFQFTAIGTVPEINQLQVGSLFFAMVADPTSANDVYIGGEFSPHLFRGNAVSNTWTSITGANASGSTPHDRVRSLKFQDNNTLVSTGEGGIYRLNSPLTTNGTWTSAGGNINAFETISLAYDPTPGLLLAGTQDNGSIKQTSTSSNKWKQTGIGRGYPAHDRIGDVDYFLGGHFANFVRIDSQGNESRLLLGANSVQHDITNVVVSPTNPIAITSPAHGLTTGQAVYINGLNGITYDGFGIFGFYEVTVINANTFSLSNTVNAIGTYANGSTWVLSGLDNSGGSSSDQKDAIQPVDVEFGNHYRLIQLATNAVRGNSILFGRNGLYESVSSSGDVIVNLTSQLTGKAANDRINAIVYGGRQDGVDHPGIFYVGTAEGKLYRRNESNTVSLVTIPGAIGAIKDIAVDPEDWQNAFVIVGDSASQIFATEDGGNSWANITDNLSISFLSISVDSIAFASDTRQGGDGELFIAGLGNVFRRRATETAGGYWSIAAQGLPNTKVVDLLYEKTNNTLYAATVGRGVWALDAGLLGSNALQTNANWVDEGPGPATNSNIVVPPNNQVNGAIESISFHPTNSNIAYAGAVSGGVWRTNNFGNPNPTWVPLTDDLPSMSTGAIAVSPLDVTGNTVFLGTAALSGAVQDSDLEKGLFVTIDGGTTWNNVAPASVFNGAILRILPTTVGNNLSDQIILVAAANGISRSTNGGTTWTLISGSAGLPTGYATDIIADPNNPNRYYAAIPDNGVYVSTNAGANWSRIDNNPGFSISGIAGSSMMRLSIHDAGTTSVLYVGVVNADGELAGVYRDVLGGDGLDNNSANGADDAAEFQFTAIGTVPRINQLKFGLQFFGLVADPTSANDVYIGGEFSPHLFRGNAVSNTWTSITGTNASNSTPHNRVRSLKFQDNTTLVATGEGGIYRLGSPLTTNGIWTSAGGNINAFETVSVAYDPTPGLLLTGTPNNSAKQIASGSNKWRETVTGLGIQAHDRISDIDYSTGGQFANFVRFDSQGNKSHLLLGANGVQHPITNAVASPTNPIVITSVAHGLTTGQAVHLDTLPGMTYDGFAIAGFYEVTVIDANTFSLSNTVNAVGTYGGGSSWVLSGLDNSGGSLSDQQNAIQPVDVEIANLFTSIQVANNAVRGNSILIGRRGLYESVSSRGDVIVNLTSQLTGKTANDRINSIVYGGRHDGVDHPEIFYVGTAEGKLYLRNESNTVSLVTIPGAVGAIRDIAVDPEDWRHAFVLVGNLALQIFATVDGGVTWSNITDNFSTSFPSAFATTIAFASNTSQVGDGELFISGKGGIIRRPASATPGAAWSIVTQGLPHLVVSDLLYEETNSTLYAATLGRGVWSLVVGVPENKLVNSLLIDLNAGNKNQWLNKVARTNVIYSTEEETRDRLIVHNGPDSRGFATDQILSFTDSIGRRPSAGEIWFESFASGHGGDGTVSTFSSVDPFLNDPNIGTKLLLKPITGAAVGGASVDHTDLVNHVYTQTQILNAIGASAFSNLNIETSLASDAAASALKFLQLAILEPASTLRDASTRVKEMLEKVLFENRLSTALASVGVSLADLLPIDDLWQNRVTNPLNSLLASTPSASMSQIVAALNAGLHTNAFTVELDNTVERSIRFNFDASFFSNIAGSAPSINAAINLGAGNTLSAGGNFTFASNLTFGGVLGIDLTNDDLGNGGFLRDLNLTLGGSGSIASINANVNLGGLNAGVQNGSFDMSAAVNVALTSPSTASSTVRLGEIVDNLDTIKNLVELTPTATIDLELPLNLTNSGSNFNLADWGQPIVRASSANLFTDAPDIVVDITLTDNLQDRVRSILSSLDDAADNIASRPAFNQVIPGIGRSLNGLLNEVGGPQDLTWGDVIKFEQAAEDYFGTLIRRASNSIQRRSDSTQPFSACAMPSQRRLNQPSEVFFHSVAIHHRFDCEAVSIFKRMCSTFNSISMETLYAKSISTSIL